MNNKLLMMLMFPQMLTSPIGMLAMFGGLSMTTALMLMMMGGGQSQQGGYQTAGFNFGSLFTGAGTAAISGALPLLLMAGLNKRSGSSKRTYVRNIRSYPRYSYRRRY